MPKTLLIDNYDSFTYNLYQLIAETTGEAPVVVRNDETDWAQLEQQGFGRIVISPGPGRPQCTTDLGLSADAIRHATVPILGVCLGHQAIAHALGASVGLAREPIHGRLSDVVHDGTGLFEGVPSPFKAVRYHSLAVTDLPSELEATAWTADGTIMAMRHRTRPLWGVQFHPESICTEYGASIIRRFYEMSGSTAAAIPPARPSHPVVEPTSTASAYRLFAFRHELNPDPSGLFASVFARSEDAFWLDSSLHDGDAARFSYMGDSSGPRSRRIRYRADSREIEISERGSSRTQHGDIFDYLEQELRSLGRPEAELPFDFCGGYVGYFSYELKGALQGKMPHAAATPDACWIFADRMVVLDHLAGNMWLLCLSDEDELDHENAQWVEHVLRSATVATGPAQLEHVGPTGRLTELRWRHRPDEYRRLIERALELIRQGETYEVCLTNQLSAKGDIDPFLAYLNLRQINPSPYAAYLKAGELSVLCGSPELFLSISSDRVVTSKPIKGTAPRHADPLEDARLSDELAKSEKARSENLMIVDLLRNDLGRICEVGSIHVPHLFEVETFASVHQLVSTIRGTLGSDRSAFDCIRAAFPGGSMTGAPKVRTMAIIDDLEAGARGIYSGSLGYLSLSGSVRLNIVIRTIVINGSDISLGSGGAIVAMSDPEEELDEVLLKLQAQLRTLRSCGAEFEVDDLLREFPLISAPDTLADSGYGTTLPGVADKLHKMRSHPSPYEVDVLGVGVLVLPEVWSPAYDWSGLYFIENLPDVRGRSFLDVGCGTGLISLFAARAGASHVVGVDINPAAVRNCALNFERSGITHSQAYLVEGFDGISGAFDVIVWNAPHHDAPPQGLLDRSCVDEGYKDIRSFFASIGKHLNPQGTVLFGYSEDGDLKLIDSLIASHGFQLQRTLSDTRQGYNCLIFELQRQHRAERHVVQ